MSSNEKKLKERLAAQRQNTQATADLSGLGLTEIPQEVFNWSHIRQLYLRDNDLHNLPEDWGALSNLEYLDLSNNRLEQLGEAIGQLSQLRTLEVRNNRLREVSDAIGQMGALEYLDLSHNVLDSLPETMSELSSLYEVNLSSNCFERAPAVWSSEQVHVNCQFNLIESVEVAMEAPGHIDTAFNPYTATIETLHDYLEPRLGRGQFCVTGYHDQPPPKLSIDGLGEVNLPLDDQTHDTLSAKAQRAPFGRGTQTLVDHKVRKTWQIQPEDVHILDPNWPNTLNTITTRASRGLGVHSPTHATFYKMLIYEPGDFFVPHQDTEKEDGMFATLVVVLPSTFEGGALVVEHNGQSVVFSQSNLPENGISWAAFFTDCTHELQEVTQGYRVVLVYNLCHDDATQVTRPTQPHVVSRIRQHLTPWASIDTPNLRETMALILSHQYTRAELCFEHLKGKDLHLGNLMLEASKDGLFDVHLAILSLEEWGHVGYRNVHGEEQQQLHQASRQLKLTHWVDRHGNQSQKEIELSDIQTIPEVMLDALEPIHHATHYTGNEGTEYERFYEHCALVISLPEGHNLNRRDVNVHADYEFYGLYHAQRQRAMLAQPDTIKLTIERIKDTFLPNNISAPTHLREVDFRVSDVYESPTWFGELSALERLRWPGESLQLLVRHLPYLEQLRHLDISQSSLYQVDEILMCLEALRHTKTLESLVMDDLQGHGHTTQLIATLASLEHLQYLSLRYNDFEQFPKALYEMKQLKRLDLRHCPFGEIPTPPKHMSVLFTKPDQDPEHNNSYTYAEQHPAYYLDDDDIPF